MATYLRNGTDLRSSQYKKLTGLLSNLEGLLPYAELADALPNSGAPALVVDPVQIATSHSRTPAPSKRRTESALHPQLAELLRRFQQPQALSASGVAVDRIAGKDRRLGKKDAEGRVVAVGRRKESGARVWIVPVAQDAAAAEDAIPGRVLVNSLPLPAYFTLLPHRAAAIHPLSLTSTLGSFNVFAIAKGGGLAAQADAVAMGLSRALIEWERCEVEAGRLEEGQYGWRSVLKSGESSRARGEELGADPVPYPSRSQARRARPEDGGEEEDGTAQGEEKDGLGQAIGGGERGGAVAGGQGEQMRNPSRRVWIQNALGLARREVYYRVSGG